MRELLVSFILKLFSSSVHAMILSSRSKVLMVVIYENMF